MISDRMKKNLTEIYYKEKWKFKAVVESFFENRIKDKFEKELLLKT